METPKYKIDETPVHGGGSRYWPMYRYRCFGFIKYGHFCNRLTHAHTRFDSLKEAQQFLADYIVMKNTPDKSYTVDGQQIIKK